MFKVKEMNFIAHFELLKQLLDIDPSLVQGDEAKELIANCGGCSFVVGGYIHMDNLNTVAVTNSRRIEILAHEMRHAWQYKNKDTEGFSFTPRPVGLLALIRHWLVYFTGRKELDANMFALHYCALMGSKKQVAECLVGIVTTWLFRLGCVLLLASLVWLCSVYGQQLV